MLPSGDVPSLPALLGFVAVLAPVLGRAEVVSRALSVEAELGAGLDDNPDRLTGSGSPAAEFLSLLVKARGSLEGEGAQVRATLIEGGRLYPGPSQADAVASLFEASASAGLSRTLTAGLELRASDLSEEGQVLDDDTVRAQALLAYRVGRLRARLGAGFGLDRPRGPTLWAFEALGPEASIGLEVVPARQHALSAGYAVEYDDYPRFAELAQRERADTTQTLLVDYRYDGDFLAGLGYAYAWNRSSAPGGDFERHRLTARLAAYLPLELTLALRVALQWSHYPQPLYLEEQLLLAEENQNLLEVRLTRPLCEGLELALAGSAYREEATPGTPAPGFARDLVSLSLVWRGSWRSVR